MGRISDDADDSDADADETDDAVLALEGRELLSSGTRSEKGMPTAVACVSGVFDSSDDDDVVDGYGRGSLKLTDCSG